MYKRQSHNNSLIIRTNIIGFRGQKKLTFFEWILDSIKTKKKIELFHDYYTSSINVNSFSKILFDLHKTGYKGIVNVGSREFISKADFIKRVFKKIDFSDINFIRSSVDKLPIQRAKNCGMNVNKAERLLNYKLPTIDDVIQSPLSYTPIVYDLEANGGQIGTGSTVFSMTGITSIRNGDILKIDNEFMKVGGVGLGTTSVGPISDGDVKLIEVVRGAVGTAATLHTDGTAARIYRGSYNFAGQNIFFTDPPKGSGLVTINESNLPKGFSEFNGRVFLSCLLFTSPSPRDRG